MDPPQLPVSKINAELVVARLTDCANEERIVKTIDRHWLAIDLGQELNRQSILDILQIDAALNMRRAVPDERLDNGALVIGISDGLGNVGTEPGPNKVGGIGRIGRGASKMMSSISRGLIAPLLDAHVQTWREESRDGDGNCKLEEHDSETRRRCCGFDEDCYVWQLQPDLASSNLVMPHRSGSRSWTDAPPTTLSSGSLVLLVCSDRSVS